jgi:hybrid cluster-associated redox disulfide protein
MRFRKKYVILIKEELNMQVTKDMLMGDLLRKDINVAYILMGSGMHCVGCPSSQMESLSEACFVHGLDADEVIKYLNYELGLTAAE